MYLKAEQLSISKWRVLAIPFGGPFKGGKDIDGEFFSPRTDIKAEWFPSRPLLFQHGQDGTVKDDAIGRADDLEKADDGWWVTTWLDKASQYHARVNALLAAGKMYGSSGSLSYLASIDHRTGEILKWPYVEQTFTPTPSNLFSRVVPAKADAHFISAGIALGADLESYLSQKDGDDPAMSTALDGFAQALEALTETIRTT